ncbi:hypothetical protein PCANC_12909 [Puccinia coronata f. sp. avenae]|uniref:C2H2-type domain-containing protein n=1 Tax=Puccinia coronata f. sp. avenae TaxID=200324 RepID=A0A2N5SM67_9BASI|nr:hypothetical protein PCASD_18029 [Puccinia coronata f. sp. avenae]PLW39207.1 hypothetical protein PCANC_12909 [Puccinia coronata f. sp. avenae]
MNETTTKGKRKLSFIDDSPLPEEESPCTPSRTQTAPATKSTKQSGPSASSVFYTCSLPPTCNPPHHEPPRFDNPGELESHHRTHHAFTCASTGCERIFPSQYFLDLHLNEVHNPLLLVQRETRHTKIFRCFEQACKKSFSNPKARRLHLIDMHSYPRTFFFSLPNQGLNNLYKKFGPGVSLVRPEWKPSTGQATAAASEILPSNHNSSNASARKPPVSPMVDSEHMSGIIEHRSQNGAQNKNEMDAIDSVVDSIQHLSFVPRQIQFGKKAGSKSFYR